MSHRATVENDALLEALIVGLPTRTGPSRADRARDVLPVVQRLMAQAWDAGHATDEHGPNLCECPNPYRAPAACDCDTLPTGADR